MRRQCGCLIAAAMALAGCAPGPSESDIQKALQRKEDAVGSFLGARAEIVTVRKNKCQPMDGGRFRCTFTATGRTGKVTRDLELSRVFEEMNSGWVIASE